MGFLDNLGSRARDRIAAAEHAPMRPPSSSFEGDLHNEGDRWWISQGGRWQPTTPSKDEIAAWRVSQVAEEIESLQQVTKQLVRSLQQKLGTTTYTIQGELDYERLMHVITAHRLNFLGGRNNAAQVFEIPDEELRAATVDVASFKKFITDLAEDVRGYGQSVTTTTQPLFDPLRLGTVVNTNTTSSNGWIHAQLNFDAAAAAERERKRRQEALELEIAERAAIDSILGGEPLVPGERRRVRTSGRTLKPNDA